ncbi:glycine receptor subunit alpha-4 isoform X2 [Nematostella vectensis]|uniref:glycine receptor subunit alpha-4 isoform X2 n=1 Tax=Nematostella vectensis TaxID=45351 RepID=UPI0020778B21|nr:glycine receptor subunit alpha-4 isoform X2 [Nematostella vectensis]
MSSSACPRCQCSLCAFRYSFCPNMVRLLLFFLALSSADGVNASAALNDMLDPKVYDKRLRPHFEGDPVKVSISFFLTSIGGLNEQEMLWTDPRLAYGHVYKKRNLTLGGDIMKQIWKPDTYINNEKSSTVPENQFLLTIDPEGRVVYSQRMTVVASCMMYLRNYPMDTQSCSISFESYGMNNDDLLLSWKADPGDKYKNAVIISDNLTMSQFALDEYHASKETFTYPTGTFTLLKLTFSIRRKKFYYVVQTYIPTILIVILSWVSFWIPRSSPPARVALGITTVLALTTLIFGIQSSMPRVSYVKAIDWFLMVSFLFVFCALIEYPSSTFIKFQAKRITRKGTTILRRVKGEKANGEDMSGDFPLKTTNYGTTASNQQDEGNDQRPIKRPGRRNGNTENHVIINERMYKMEGGYGRSTDDLTPYTDNFTDNEETNTVDRYARICFPFAYFLYNLGYWTVYLVSSS